MVDEYSEGTTTERKRRNLAQRSPSLTLTIPKQGFDEIGRLARHAAKLATVVAASAKTRFGAKPSAMYEQVATETGIPVADVDLIISGLASLRTLMDKLPADASDLVAAITAAVSSEATEGWLEQNLKNWEAGSASVSAALQSITPDHPIWIRQKARNLTYAHQNIFKSTRIITDLRPVFNTTGDSIGPMVLTHVLSIEYFDGVRNQRIEFALDENDVRELGKSVERAQVKTKTTRKQFGERGWTLIVAGEPEDAPGA